MEVCEHRETQTGNNLKSVVVNMEVPLANGIYNTSAATETGQDTTLNWEELANE